MAYLGEALLGDKYRRTLVDVLVHPQNIQSCHVSCHVETAARKRLLLTESILTLTLSLLLAVLLAQPVTADSWTQICPGGR